MLNSWHNASNEPATVRIPVLQVGDFAPGRNVDPAVWYPGIMYSCMLSKAKNYCLETFHNSLNYFCDANRIEKMVMPDPDKEIIDYFSSWNFTIPHQEGAMAVSQHNENTSSPVSTSISNHSVLSHNSTLSSSYSSSSGKESESCENLNDTPNVTPRSHKRVIVPVDSSVNIPSTIPTYTSKSPQKNP